MGPGRAQSQPETRVIPGVVERTEWCAKLLAQNHQRVRGDHP